MAVDKRDTDQAPVTPEPDVPEMDADLVSDIETALDEAEAATRADGNLLSYRWVTDDYAGSGNTGSAADKLSDSAVAPLVAAARGYETVIEDTLAEATKRLNLPRRNTTQGKRIANAVTRGDLLIMPWYTADDLAVGARREVDPVPTTIQYRPSRPDTHPKTGREMKYEFVAGSKTPVAVHPAYGQDWINDAPVVLLAEGLLKGDSAMTGYLLDAGVPVSDLAWPGGTVTEARTRLNAILDKIDPAKRIVILTIGGVDNWKNNNEWRDLELAERDVWLGIDGDVSTNPHVFRAARELWEFLTDKKRATVSLIAPTVQAPGGDDKKVGIDDYLSHHGTWRGLLAMRSSKLPPAPPTKDLERVGEYRISDDGTVLELCHPRVDPFNPDGDPIGGDWKPVYNLGGRILSTVAQRVPTPAETKTGVLGEGADNDAAEAYCEVEIAWRSEAGDALHHHTVTGPAEILNYPPDQWVRHKAHIPAAVLRHPEWPPPRKLAEDWLRAVKGHRADEIQERVRWDSMGWVPVEGSVPAFVIGDQVIGDEDSADVDIFPGITETELAGANRFGVGDLSLGSFNDPEYRAKVKADIEEVIEGFILSGAWTDRAVASTVVAAALRPAIPIRPHATLFLVGPPSKGKALPLDARIPVPVSEKFPTGWALNSELAVGDEVFAADGTVTRVLFLSDVIDDMDTYRFTLSNGQEVDSTASHLWKVSTKQSRTRKGGGRLPRRDEAARLRGLAAEFSNGHGVTLGNMAETFGVPQNLLDTVVTERGIRSEQFYGAYGDEATGEVLTDTIHTVRLYPVGETLLALADHLENAGPVERIMTSAEIAALADDEPAIRLGDPIEMPEADLPVDPYVFGTRLASEGIGRIPAAYLRASLRQRIDLFDGLFGAETTLAYVDRDLALGACELAQSIALHANLALGTGGWSVTITRDAEWLDIAQVDQLDPVPSRCIQVEHETGMFLGVGFVPTHNSWTAALMMGFWSRRPGAFTASSLPGSAKDTPASMETAVARAPIWVIDDLAPASSRQQSESEQNKIGNLIRNVFNGAGKRRSTVDLGSRKVFNPRSLLIVTAENNADVGSVADRCITLDIGWGALPPTSEPTDLVQELCQEKGTPARLTQAMIRFLRHEAKLNNEGWRGLYTELEDAMGYAQGLAAAHMKDQGAKSGDIKRHADLAADLTVTLFVLHKMAERVGVRDEILDLISASGMAGDIHDLVMAGHKAGKEIKPGRSLIAAIQAALFKKAAHVLDAVDPSAMPGGPRLGPHLGWQVGAGSAPSQPRGPSIGWYVVDQTDGRPYLYLDTRAAFSVAQKEQPELVPYGQGQRQSWGSAKGEGFVAEHLLRTRADGSKMNTGRTRRGTTDISGIPVPLDVILNGGDMAPPVDDGDGEPAD